MKKLIGILLAIATYFLMEGHVEEVLARTAGVTVLIASWWVMEATHLSITALIPLVLFPVLEILPMKQVSTQYMNPIIFLFIGGFVMAFAMEKWNLHKRIALSIIAKLGKTPAQLLLAFMLSSFLLSMFILNTTTVIMLLPATLAIIKEIQIENKKSFAEAILLGIAYAANIGGIATLIGTAPNLYFAEFYNEHFPQLESFDFLSWMVKILPLSVILFFVAYLVLRNNYFFRSNKQIELTSIKASLKQLGKMKYEEKMIAFYFILAMCLWIIRPFLQDQGILQKGFVHDGTIAIFLSIALFFTSSKNKKETLVDWSDFQKIPIGILLLFGGGFALAKAIQVSGLGTLIAQSLDFLEVYPSWLIVFVLAIFMTFFTEITSNTASTQLILPILLPLIIEFNWDAPQVLLAITLSASCAFMLPVATPPNTVVFGSEMIQSRNMLRVGIILNLICALIISFYLNLMY